jgi:hypothetical protein
VKRRPHGRTRTRRRFWLILPIALVAVLAAAYFTLDLTVTYATQKGLDRLKGVTGSFQKLHVTVFHPGYNVYGLKVTEMPVTAHKEPIFYADRIEMRWSWREIVRGHLVRNIKVWRARVMVPMRPGENGKPAQPPLEIAKTLESVPSAGLERLSLVNSEISIVDRHHNGERLWFHDVDATIENAASRKQLMRGLPLLVTARGKLQRSGELVLFLTVDPFDRGLTFAGSAEIRHLQLSDLHQFTTIKGLTLPEGKLDVFASVTCKRGEVTGGVKPILENVKVKAADDKLGHKIKAFFADVAVKILSDRVPGRHALATVIPIHGDLRHLDVQVTPAIMGVLRNAFVEGLSASLSNVPPPLAEKKQGFFRQARQALTKKNKQPVRAQPRK